MTQPPNLPLVSIITPVYNGAAYIEELIQSVLAQNYPNLEHIIIDDGSKDDGATVSILKKYPHLHWWTRPNQGQYFTMNEGLRAAKGDYVCFICADDLLNKNAVSLAMNWMQQHPEYDGVYGLTAYISEDGKSYPYEFPFRKAPIKYYAYFSQIAHCSLYVSRKALIDRDLFFNPEVKFVADYDWILRMIRQGLRIGFVDMSLSTVRLHQNQTSAVNRLKMVDGQKEIAARNGFGGFRYHFFMFFVHWANFSKQIKQGFQENRLKGALKVVRFWIVEKILARLRR